MSARVEVSGQDASAAPPCKGNAPPDQKCTDGSTESCHSLCLRCPALSDWTPFQNQYMEEIYLERNSETCAITTLKFKRGLLLTKWMRIIGERYPDGNGLTELNVDKKGKKMAAGDLVKSIKAKSDVKLTKEDVVKICRTLTFDGDYSSLYPKVTSGEWAYMQCWWP